MGYNTMLKIISIMMVLFQQVAGFSLQQDQKSSAFRTTTIAQYTSFFRYRHTTNALSLRTSSTTSMRSKESEDEEFEFYDDGIGDISSKNYYDSEDASSSSSSSGDDLVGEFYKEIDRREKEFDYVGEKLKEEEAVAAAIKEEKDTTFSDPLSTFLSPSSLFDDNGEEKSSVTSKSNNKSKQKFTGKTNNIGSSRNTSNYFGGGGGSFSSSSTANSGNTNTNNNSNGVREEMMRNEFNLVSAATGKTSFIIQVGITLSMLIFFIYIGLSGGIVTGDDVETIRGAGVDDIIQFDQIIPIPTDTENTIWL
jgi:hypothetical protein